MVGDDKRDFKHVEFGLLTEHVKWPSERQAWLGEKTRLGRGMSRKG